MTGGKIRERAFPGPYLTTRKSREGYRLAAEKCWLCWQFAIRR